MQVVGPSVADRAGPGRRAAGDQELVIEERPAEGGLEEMIGDDKVGAAGAVQIPVQR